MRVSGSLIAAAFLALAVTSRADIQQDWVVHWGGSGDDAAVGVVTDGAGGIYVLGKTHNGSDYDYVVLKYDRDAHALVWERVYDRGHGDDVPRDIAVLDDWVYVTGESYNGDDLDYLTLRISASSGGVDWVATYDGGYGDDEAYAVAASGSYVYVTGESRGFANDDVRTICYGASSGSLIWNEKYNGGMNDYATAIAIDDAGCVYVVGGTGRAATGMNFLTIAYDAGGTELWSTYKDGPASVENDPDLAWDVAIYGENVLVTGQLNGVLCGLDYGTVCYRKSDGYERWVRMYDGPAGGPDKARAIAVGDDGSVWVTGTSLQSSSWDQSCIVTIRYDLSGNELCHDTHCSGMQYAAEEGRDVCVDEDGNAWVAGKLLSPSYDYDFSVDEIDGSCDRPWSDAYDRTGADDEAVGIAIDDGGVYVAGQTWEAGDLDITTIRYADVPPVQELTLLGPSGGEHWYVGTEHTITWVSEGIDYVRIEYTSDWGSASPTWHTIASSTPSDGSYTWEVPLIPDEPSDECRIRMSDAADGDPSDVSDGSFEIYRFLITRDGFGFDDDSHHSGVNEQIWPSACWEDYSGYPYTESGFDWEARTEEVVDAWAILAGEDPGEWPAGSAFPSWPMFVDAFGESRCYFDPPDGSPYDEVVFRPSAVRYWFFGLPKIHFGSCLGFSLVSCLVFDDLVPLSSLFPGYGELHDVPLGDCSDSSGKMTTNRYFTRLYGAQHRAHIAANVLSTCPTATLNAVKSMLADEERDHRMISLWRKHMSMAHYDVPVRVEPHPTDPDIEYIYLYENFYADVDTCRLEIDKSTDTWTYHAGAFDPAMWTGQGCRLFLMDDPSSYLSPSLLPYEYPGEIVIASAPGAYASFDSPSRGLAGPIVAYTTMGSLSFEDQVWTCEFDSLSSGLFAWSVFTDEGTAFCYERSDAVEGDTEEMRYAGDGVTVTVLNPGASTRTHEMAGIGARASYETECVVDGLGVTPGDSVRYRIVSDGGLRIDNFGSTTSYDLTANIVDATGSERFLHESIEIPGSTRHRIWLNWLDNGGRLSVDVDYGIDGYVDEVIWVENQSDWVGVPSHEGAVGPVLVARASPNPFGSRATVEYCLPVPGAVSVEVFSPGGRRVAVLAEGVEDAGWHSVEWAPSELPSGVYFLRVRAAGREETWKLVHLE